MLVTTYFVAHKDRSYAGSRVIADAVNRITGDSGDSAHRERVQEELDSFCTKETQDFYGLHVAAQEIEIEDGE